ncbi:hypothetical protein Cob_v000247 [Colletotrichum orbiculare MAFF 240422]|uniref:Uncharacterized protein n=1 Tax=Colletotrichum orbiculare (strain 104-T / ATCC 96160 / CBS 514.97 / LARS 414 / MAFF 240422) TaxID=1213857 RepID=A0A484G8A4_COLOR|nr:hypothetical protein Cob_v000247 [Colletotrichum orbiculare MAFF 240422]
MVAMGTISWYMLTGSTHGGTRSSLLHASPDTACLMCIAVRVQQSGREVGRVPSLRYYVGISAADLIDPTLHLETSGWQKKVIHDTTINLADVRKNKRPCPPYGALCTSMYFILGTQGSRSLLQEPTINSAVTIRGRFIVVFASLAATSPFRLADTRNNNTANISAA